MNNLQIKKVFVDVQDLERSMDTITEETKKFKSDLCCLEQCIAELNLYWEGMASKEFRNNIFLDFQMLRSAANLYSKLSDDCSFAVNEYKKTDQISYEIIMSIKNI